MGLETHIRCAQGHDYTGFNMSDDWQVLEVNYMFNPELDGIEPEETFIWRSTSWHVSRLDGSAKHRAYLEKLRDWAVALHPKVRAGFKGRQPAD